MSYNTNEASTHDGEPVECFKFITPVRTFRYTSDPEKVTMGGEEYLPLNIERSAIETNTLSSSVQTVDFTVPARSDIAALVAFRKTPELLTVEVRRAHRSDNMNTDFALIYSGRATGTTTGGDETKIETASLIQTSLRDLVANIVYTRKCNHELYDARCKVNSAAYTLQATITRLQGQIITVDNDGVANGDLVGGEMINTRTGERRGIAGNTDNVVSIGFAFTDVEIGDVVQLRLGCNKLRLGHCKNRFANVANYGGFDFIPTTNPFTDLNSDNQATVTENVSNYIIQERLTSRGTRR